MMTADSKSVEAAVGRVEQNLKRLNSATAGMRQGFGAIVGGADPFEILKGGAKGLLESIPKVGPAIGAAVNIAESFWNKLRDTQKQMGEEVKHAWGLGASVQGYGALKFAVGDAEALDRAMLKLSDTVGEAALKGGDAAMVFQRLGLDANQLSGLSVDKQFRAVVDQLGKIDNATMRNKLSMDLFGKSTLALLPALSRGSEWWDKMAKRAGDRGLIMSDREAAAITAANAAMKQLDQSTERVWRQMAISFAPLVKSIADDMSRIKIPNAEKGEYGAEVRLLQLKNMVEDVGDFFQGKWAGEGGSALNRAIAEKAKFDREAEELVKRQKREALEIQRQEEEKRKADDAAKEAQRRAAEFDRQVDRVAGLAVGPYDALMRKIDEVNQVFDAGRITVEQYHNAIARTFDDAARQFQSKPSLPAPLLYGSSEAVSAVNRWRNQESGLANSGQETREILTRIKEYQARSAKANEETAKALKDLKVAKI